MKTPSIDKLALVFSEAKRAKEIMQMTRRELTKTESGIARLINCVHAPKTHTLRLSVLNALNSGLFGVECIISEKGEYADYLNTGDVYADTLIYWRGNYRVQSIGDFIETMERQGVKFK